MDMLSLNVNRTELSPIRSVFIRVIKGKGGKGGIKKWPLLQQVNNCI